MNELALCEPRRPFARLLLHYNPFYLLSAMCMLFGLFALNDSLDWSPLPRNNLLWLILILNVYELTLIGLGIFLARRGLMRDAGTLFVLEAFFLVDAGFLNAEIFNFDFTIGLAVNVGLFMLAFLKVAAVFWGLGIPVSDRRYALIMVQILLLAVMPGILKEATDRPSGLSAANTIYLLWWAVGLLPILFLLLRSSPDAAHSGIIGAFVLLPVVSIIAHLSTSNWVYHVRWSSANLSPLILGLATSIGAADHHVHNLAARMRLQLCLPVLGILLAASNPTPLLFSSTAASLTPLRITLIAAALVYLHGTWVHRHPYFGAASLACLGAAGLGGDTVTMTRNARDISNSGGSALWRLVPRTLMQWGLVSVVSSFVLLAIGLVRSLTHRPAVVTVEAEDRVT